MPSRDIAELRPSTVNRHGFGEWAGVFVPDSDGYGFMVPGGSRLRSLAVGAEDIADGTPLPDGFWLAVSRLVADRRRP